MIDNNTLKVISFNCKGFKERNYDYLNFLFSKCDILLIQESWLYSFEFGGVSNVLPGSICLGVSAMSEDDIGRRGRPYGGCLIVHKRNFPLPVVQINTLSKRICAAKIVQNEIKILLVSVYMPTEIQNDFLMNEYQDVVNETSGLLHIYDDFNIVIGGNFNVDFNRPSRNLDVLKIFIVNESLICSNNMINQSDYTFETADGSRSFIDHFILD